MARPPAMRIGSANPSNPRTRSVGRATSLSGRTYGLTDKSWSVARVQQEQLRVGPHVAQIGGNEKRQVADQTDALRTGVFFQALSLAKQQELRKPNLVDTAGKFPASRGHGCWGTLDQHRRPFEVIGTLVFRLECSEQGVVVEPVRLVVAGIGQNWTAGPGAPHR